MVQTKPVRQLADSQQRQIAARTGRRQPGRLPPHSQIRARVLANQSALGQPIGAGDLSLVRKPMPPGQDIRPERRCAFLGRHEDMLKLRSIGIRDYSVFEGGQRSGRILFAGERIRASGFGASLLSPELIWKEYGDVVMTLAVSDHRKPT
jgi:hypothetical protein